MLEYLTAKIQQILITCKFYNKNYFHLHQNLRNTFWIKYYIRWKYIHKSSIYPAYSCTISSALGKLGSDLGIRDTTLRRKSSSSRLSGTIWHVSHHPRPYPQTVEVKQPTSTWQISLNHPPIVHFSHLYLLNMYDNSNGGKKPMGNNTNGPAIQCSSNHWCNTGVVNTVSITIWLKI